MGRVTKLGSIPGVLLLAAACLLGTALVRADDPYDVIVIGAGASGIGAITRLTEHGYKVLGLEAKNRIAGRVNTQEFGGGHVEFGAEWIHGAERNVVYQLARENQVPIIDTVWKRTIRSLKPINETVAMELVEACINFYDEMDGAANETQGEVITRRFYEYIADRPAIKEDDDFCRNFLKMFEVTIGSNDGTDTWHDISVSGADDYVACGGSQAWSFHRLTYKTLFDILLHKYNNGTGVPVDIRLEQEVTEIDWAAPENTLDASASPLVSVKTASGTTYQAKAVIVTVSLGVLKHSHESLFKPSLPRSKVQAIEALSFGVVDKVCLHYETRWWGESNWFMLLWTDAERAKLAPEDAWLTNVTGFSMPNSNDRVLTVWLTGPSARHMETLSMEVLKEKIDKLLGIFFKDVAIAELKDIRRTTWFSDPHVRGSYSFHGIPSDSLPDATNILAAPILIQDKPVVLFAGEATNQEHHSTVNGALETGWREAERYHRYYKK